MLAHEALHLFGLLHRFGEQVSPQAAEQRQVGLVEQSQFVEPFVNFGLDGPLREAQVVHVAELRQQDVVDELGRVAPDYTLLQVPHRVGSPQADLLSVQVHAPGAGTETVSIVKLRMPNCCLAASSSLPCSSCTVTCNW